MLRRYRTIFTGDPFFLGNEDGLPVILKFFDAFANVV